MHLHKRNKLFGEPDFRMRSEVCRQDHHRPRQAKIATLLRHPKVLWYNILER